MPTSFSKNCDFSKFSQFLEKSQFLLRTLLPPVPLYLINFSKNCDFSNFSQFLEESQKLQKSQFLLDTLVPPVTLELIYHKLEAQFLLIQGDPFSMVTNELCGQAVNAVISHSFADVKCVR